MVVARLVVVVCLGAEVVGAAVAVVVPAGGMLVDGRSATGSEASGFTSKTSTTPTGTTIAPSTPTMTQPRAPIAIDWLINVHADLILLARLPFPVDLETANRFAKSSSAWDAVGRNVYVTAFNHCRRSCEHGGRVPLVLK